jgi:hypothetical protein
VWGVGEIKWGINARLVKIKIGESAGGLYNYYLFFDRL